MNTPTGEIPRIFVSHSHHDNSFCRPFVAHLRAALGLRDVAHIFYDESALHLGDEWLPRIQQEVMSRPIFIVVLTPHSVQADYVKVETNLALRASIGHTDRRVFSVLAEPCDPNQLAPLLLSYQMADIGKRGYDAAIEEMVEAIRAFARGEPIPPESGGSYTNSTPDPRLVRARELAAEAREALRQNLLAAAIAKAQSALERFDTLGAQVAASERADVSLTLADACAQSGQWQRSLDAAARGRKEDPDRLDGYLLQAAAQRELNQPDQAQQALDQALAVVSLSDVTQNLRFLASQRALDASQQQWERALSVLDEEQRLAPDDTTVVPLRLNLLGHWRAALADKQQWTEALGVLDNELALVPNDHARLGARLDLLQRAGQTAAALTLARQLTAHSDATAAVWLARARLARQVEGDHADQEVTAALDAAARLAPTDPAIAQARRNLFPPAIPAERFPPRLADLGFTPRRLTVAGKPVEFILPSLCPVPAGPFRMGSDPKQDSGAYDSEKPQHEVNVAAFQIARFPVTVAEYACFVRAGHAAPQQGTYRPITWEDQLKRLDHPVVCVLWHDATAYAAWLAQLTGQAWRLPTEAEWEKAARFDPATRASRIYPWGDAFYNARANTSEGGPGGTTPVGTYPSGASPCGAQDMAGNVWEWTSSIIKPYPYNGSDGRERADSTENRVLRGGSWGLSSWYARAAYRDLYRPGGVNGGLGFRVVCAVPSS